MSEELVAIDGVGKVKLENTTAFINAIIEFQNKKRTKPKKRS
jgi:hypothetical protein